MTSPGVTAHGRNRNDSKVDTAVLELRSTIGSMLPGDRLPSERELAERWGIARMTARRAIEQLANEGLIERRRGAGTFIAQRPQARLSGLSGFTSDMLQSGKRPGTRTIRFDVGPATDSEADALGVSADHEVVRFSRTRSVDDLVVAVESNTILRASVPSLTEEELDQSLFGLLVERFSIRPSEATSTIKAEACPPHVAAHLGIDPGDACLRVEMVYLDAGRRPFMSADCFYRGDSYELTVTLTGAAFAQEQS